MKGCKFYSRRGSENCNVAEEKATDYSAYTEDSGRRGTDLGICTSRLSDCLRCGVEADESLLKLKVAAIIGK